MVRVVAAALTVLLLTLATPPTVSASPAAPSYADAAFKATNAKRAAHDRVALRADGCLQRFAEKQARAMVRAGQIYHQSLERIQSACGMGYVGENVAYGYPSGQSVVAAWMKSPGHRRNILDRHFKLMGLAAEQNDDGVWYVSQVFGRRI